MAIGSGIGASLGVAAESVYGTYVAPTKFFEFTKEDLKKIKTTIQGGGLAAGRLADLGSRRVLTTVSAGGGVDIVVPTAGFGVLLANLMGSSAAPVQQAATAAYLQTHNLGDNFGKSLTVQKGVPDTTGTVRPYSFTGGKIKSASFSCAVQDTLQASFDFDFKDTSEAQSLAAPSYAASTSVFHGGQMVVKLGTFGAETAINGVTKVEAKIDRGMATDRFYASGSTPATKAEPITNEMLKCGGSISADFLDKTQLADLVASDAAKSLVMQWTGATIATTYNYQFTITFPNVYFDGDTPSVGGPDVVNTQYSFTAQSDGTNPVAIIKYQSTDVTI